MKYNKQRNFRLSITRKTKRSYYKNLDLKNITDDDDDHDDELFL